MIVGVFWGIPKLDEFSQKQAEQQRIAAEEQEKEQARIEKIEREKAEEEQRRKEDQELLEKGAENIESNSTEMIAYIKARANQDAQNIEKESEEFNQAFQFVVDNYPNYFKNNNTMEKTMYYSGVVAYVYEPRWKNEEKNEVSKSLYMEESYKLKAARCANKAVQNVYTNKETEGSYSTKNYLKTEGSYLNLVFPDKVFWEAPKTEPVPVVEVQEIVEKKEKMVWIPTNGGTKYHLYSGCSGMINPAQVTETEAKNRGFGMCKKCYG